MSTILKAVEDNFSFDINLAEQILKYAKFLTARGLIYNTFGNIALRSQSLPNTPSVIYTKPRGLSLEELEVTDVVVTTLEDGELLHGTVYPSVGHKLNREIFKCRDDVNAVIHLHPNEVIAYFSVLYLEGMKFISNDTAFVLGKPVKILDPNINVEIDVSPIKDFIQETNCIVMPQHGITTFGKSLSEAYHRATSFTAEIQRLISSKLISTAYQKPIPFVAEEEVKHMYDIAETIIYG